MAQEKKCFVMAQEKNMLRYGIGLVRYGTRKKNASLWHRIGSLWHKTSGSAIHPSTLAGSLWHKRGY